MSADWERYLAKAHKRFRAKLKFDPGTGCVLWIAGQTMGHGHSVPYGGFWFDGKKWTAHRWAAKYIHGLDLNPLHQIDHCCEPVPNTLCVQHLQSIPAQLNRELQWIRVQNQFDGGENYKPSVSAKPFTSVPFYPEPDWLKM